METITKELYHIIFKNINKSLSKNIALSSSIMNRSSRKYVNHCIVWDRLQKGVKRPALKKEYAGEWFYWAETDLIDKYKRAIKHDIL